MAKMHRMHRKMHSMSERAASGWALAPEESFVCWPPGTLTRALVYIPVHLRHLARASMYISMHLQVRHCLPRLEHLQLIADRVAKNLQIVSRTFPTNQNSAHGN